MKLSNVVLALTKFVNERSDSFPEMLLRVVLFGSYARGSANVRSDVDIALVSDRTWDIADKRDVHIIFDDFDIGAEISFFTPH